MGQSEPDSEEASILDATKLSGRGSDFQGSSHWPFTDQFINDTITKNLILTVKKQIQKLDKLYHNQMHQNYKIINNNKEYNTRQTSPNENNRYEINHIYIYIYISIYIYIYTPIPKELSWWSG